MNTEPAPDTELDSLVWSFGGKKGSMSKMFTDLKTEVFSHHVKNDHNLNRDWAITWEDIISIFGEQISKEAE